jgi:hypothetical protein
LNAVSDDVFTIERFEGRVGAIFHVIGDDVPPLELELASVTGVSLHDPASDRSRIPFSVVFHGPLDPVLPQRIYRLRDDELGDLDIFIVPIGPEGEAMQYEAIFT